MAIEKYIFDPLAEDVNSSFNINIRVRPTQPIEGDSDSPDFLKGNIIFPEELLASNCKIAQNTVIATGGESIGWAYNLHHSYLLKMNHLGIII